MTVLLCIVLLFFNPSDATNKTLENKPLQASCAVNITCPAIDAPLCVRVVRSTQEAEKKSIHIVVVNKCELLYMKCHQGLEAAVVPMKNCESRHRTRHSKLVGPIKKRSKRQADITKSDKDDTKEPDISTKSPYYSEEDDPVKPDIPTKSPYYSEEDDKIKPDIPTKSPYYSEEDDTVKPDIPTKSPYYSEEDDKIKPDIPTKSPYYSEEDDKIKPDIPTKSPYYSEEDDKIKPDIPTKSPYYSEEDDTVKPEIPTKRPYHRDDDKTPKVGSDFESQMKEFENEMKIFHEDFHKTFPSVDTGDGKHKKLDHGIAKKAKGAASDLEDFNKEMKEFKLGLQSFENGFSDGKPSGNKKVKISHQAEEKDTDGYVEEGEEDEENQKSPEEAKLVMPPPGGGIKGLADEEGIDEDDKNEGDASIDENGANGEYDENNGEVKINANGEEDKEEDNTSPLKLGDWQDYTGECPKECPSRDVMLCARCLHDVYRTFLSTCHLRMFACEQPDEKLQLVSRMPCAASAPFLTDLSDSVRRVTEAQDDDTVLRFVYCRMKGLNGGKSNPAFKGTNAKCDIAA